MSLNLAPPAPAGRRVRVRSGELGSRLSVPPSAGGLDPEQGTSGLRHQCGRARHQGHWHPHIILVIHSLFTESTECSLRDSEFLKNHQIRNKGWSIWSFMSLRSWIFQLAQLTNTALHWCDTIFYVNKNWLCLFLRLKTHLFPNSFKLILDAELKTYKLGGYFTFQLFYLLINWVLKIVLNILWNKCRTLYVINWLL